MLPGSGIYVPPPPTLPARTRVSCGAPSGWVIYYVQMGDTLYRLSVAYGITVADLQRANCMGGSTTPAGRAEALCSALGPAHSHSDAPLDRDAIRYTNLYPGNDHAHRNTHGTTNECANRITFRDSHGDTNHLHARMIQVGWPECITPNTFNLQLDFMRKTFLITVLILFIAAGCAAPWGNMTTATRPVASPTSLFLVTAPPNATPTLTPFQPVSAGETPTPIAPKRRNTFTGCPHSHLRRRMPSFPPRPCSCHSMSRRMLLIPFPC